MDSVQKRRVSAKLKPNEQTEEDRTDLREQLFNGGEAGPITRVSTPEDLITSLKGILFDIDPCQFRKRCLPANSQGDPKAFYKGLIELMLLRDPVLAESEVRSSGSGLHAILRFSEPVEFRSDGERRKWAAVVKVIQRLLPTDPHCPGITALTRPIGSVNSKTGREVRRIRKGKGVAKEAVLGLFEEIRQRPFHTVGHILFGDSPSPCPVCRGEGTSLGMMDRTGNCYEHCGPVKLSQLYDAILVRPKQRKGGRRGEDDR